MAPFPHSPGSHLGTPQPIPAAVQTVAGVSQAPATILSLILGIAVAVFLIVLMPLGER